MGYIENDPPGPRAEDIKQLCEYDENLKHLCGATVQHLISLKEGVHVWEQQIAQVRIFAGPLPENDSHWQFLYFAKLTHGMPKMQLIYDVTSNQIIRGFVMSQNVAINLQYLTSVLAKTNIEFWKLIFLAVQKQPTEWTLQLSKASSITTPKKKKEIVESPQSSYYPLEPLEHLDNIEVNLKMNEIFCI